MTKKKKTHQKKKTHPCTTQGNFSFNTTEEDMDLVMDYDMAVWEESTQDLVMERVTKDSTTMKKSRIREYTQGKNRNA